MDTLDFSNLKDLGIGESKFMDYIKQFESRLESVNNEMIETNKTYWKSLKNFLNIGQNDVSIFVNNLFKDLDKVNEILSKLEMTHNVGNDELRWLIGCFNDNKDIENSEIWMNNLQVFIGSIYTLKSYIDTLSVIIINNMTDIYDEFKEKLDRILLEFLDCGTEDDPNIFCDFIEYIVDDDYDDLCSNIYFLFLSYVSNNEDLLEESIEMLVSDKITTNNDYLENINTVIEDINFRKVSENIKYNKCLPTIVDLCTNANNESLANKLYVQN